MSAVPVHGGDLAHAKSLAVDPVDPAVAWVDLSTGINPVTYDIGAIPASVWNRLPGAALMGDLLGAARDYYRVPQGLEILAGAGSQALLQILPRVLNVAKVQIVGPTYGGHQTSWARHGCSVVALDTLEEADPAGVVIIVHPNNPSGVLADLSVVQILASKMKDAGGTLIVDEAFCDCVPDFSVVPRSEGLPTLVLKSVGKFFGLAGLRLGFAIASPDLIDKITAQLGDWPVSGPALFGGAKALADRDWQMAMRAELAAKKVRLDALLGLIEGRVIGEASLFALLETAQAGALYDHLLRHHIYVRAFEYDRDWLRIGLPQGEDEFARLEQALGQFKG